jgi:triacylglycerol lipase
MRQISPGSRFLAELNAEDETPGDIRYTSIYSMTDECCVPFTSCILKGARNKMLFLCGHIGLLVNRKAYRWLKEGIS